ncbi:hypothetical protein KP509_24G045000 [Ceratopteris richardii]|uniref:CBS domain-containing protein n=2 Tax=Ceratopteris richardii TaxID=49495 RepID=A0A8T2RWZ3_CERRI|nr:hypothetical protein KP509_24G045000 [Ceratopteris richardii]
MAPYTLRSISDTHRELNEKKQAVSEKLRAAQEPQEKGEGSIHSSDEPQTSQPPPSVQPLRDVEPREALKVFFDRIPLDSISGLKNGQVVELEARDCVGEAIKSLYRCRIMGAPLSDKSCIGDVGVTVGNSHIGVVELSSMVIWALMELEKVQMEVGKIGNHNVTTENRVLEEADKIPEENGFLRSLQQHSTLWNTKVASMSRSFRWVPFLPVQPGDTFLRALLLLAKHTLKVVPVMDPIGKKVTGFITEDTALRLLSQCSGLEWFDAIAEKALHEFNLHFYRFEDNKSSRGMLHLNGANTVLDAVSYMWEHKAECVPILDHKSEKIIGNMRVTDVWILLDNADVFKRRRSMTLQELLSIDIESNHARTRDEDERDAMISPAALYLTEDWRPKMSDVATCKLDETLKKLMWRLMRVHADCGFLVDEDMHMLGLVTLHDIITQFIPSLTQFSQAPPGFFLT